MIGLAELRREIKEAHKKEVKRMKAEILACLTSIIKRSAVDTGRYRSNWRLSLNAPDNAISDRIETEQTTIARAVAAVTNAPRGDVKYMFQNNMEYAGVIEYDYTRYAGRVRQDVDKLKQAVT